MLINPTNQPLAAAVNTFSMKETSFLLGYANENASDGEHWSTNFQSSSPKHKARHSVLKEFDLDRVADLTQRKKKLYSWIQTRHGELYKLRMKYKAKKLKEVWQLDSNPMIKSLSSLNIETSRFLLSVVRISRHKPKGRRWSYRENVLENQCLYNSWKRFLTPSTKLDSSCCYSVCANSIKALKQLGFSKMKPFFKF